MSGFIKFSLGVRVGVCDKLVSHSGCILGIDSRTIVFLFISRNGTNTLRLFGSSFNAGNFRKPLCEV